MNAHYLFNYPINENSYSISAMQVFQRLTAPDISRHLRQQIEEQVKSDLQGETLPDRAEYEKRIRDQFVITPLQIDFETRKKGGSKEIVDQRGPAILRGGSSASTTVHECFIKYHCNNRDVLTLKHMLPTPQPGIWIQDDYFGFYCYEDNLADDLQKRLDWLQRVEVNINNMIQSINSDVTQMIDAEVSACYAKLSTASSVFDALGFSKMEEKVVKAPTMLPKAPAQKGGTVINNYGNFVYSEFGNIVGTHQVQRDELPIEKIKSFLGEVRKCLRQDLSVDQTIRNEVNVQIAQLEQEIAKPDASPGTIRRILGVLGNIGTNAAGSALGGWLVSCISPAFLGH